MDGDKDRSTHLLWQDDLSILAFRRKQVMCLIDHDQGRSVAEAHGTESGADRGAGEARQIIGPRIAREQAGWDGLWQMPPQGALQLLH